MNEIPRRAAGGASDPRDTRRSTCDQCGEEFEKGTGTTERGPSRIRLAERFCSESCAEEHDRAFEEDDE